MEQAEVLLNNMLSNDNDWTLPEPPPKPTLKKRDILFLNLEDMQEAKKSMKEKGIKAEDVKNLPPIEEIHGLNTPRQVKILSSDLMKVISLIISLLVNAWMNLITLLLNKKTSMHMLVDN